MKIFIIVLLVFLYTITGISQALDVITYRDTSLPFIESELDFYNFSNPINSDIFDLDIYDPATDGAYLLATYGHRYLSNTSNKTDNHGGFDFWRDHTFQGIEYNESNKPPILCMCDGVISQVVNGPDEELEETGGGRSVQVICNEQSQAFNSDIKINYRHLSALGEIATIAETAEPSTIVINKGDVIGIMGESGITTNIHLHLSSQVNHPENGNSFVSTARLFNPDSNILKPLTNATIELLNTWSDKALFRISWPFNETINRFEFINDSYNVVFNKEEAYDTGAAIRDDHDCLPNVNVYAYQFNGRLTAMARYENEKDNIPAIYPASPQRDDDLGTYVYPHFPITENSVSYVYDFVIENLPSSTINDDFRVKLSDVWGHTVEGSLESTLGVTGNRFNTIKVYPNPTTGLINIEGDFKEIFNAKLFNIVGKQLEARQVNNSNNTIDISHFPSGLYFLKVALNNREQVFKVMKM